MKISLRNIVVPTIPMFVLLVILCALLWMSAYFGFRLAIPSTENTSTIEILQSIFLPNTLFSNIVSFAFTFINALLLAQFTTRFTMIRTRTSLPFLIFLFLMSCWNETHLVNGSHIALTIFICSLFILFDMYRDRKASEQAFLSSFLISIGSILMNPLILLIPVCWIGFIMFQSFSFRTFLASVFGVITPWILFLSGIYLLRPDIDLLQLFNLYLNTEPNLSAISLPTIIYIVSLLIILIINLVGMYSNFHSDSIHTRTKLNFLFLLLISVFIIGIAYFGQFVFFLPFIAFGYSLLISYAFTLKENNFFGYVFIIFCILNIVYVISNYFI